MRAIKWKDLNECGRRHVPGKGAAAFRAQFVEILHAREHRLAIWMPLALGRKTVVQVAMLSKDVEERRPCFLAHSTLHQRFGVSDYDERVARARQKHIQALWSCKKADVPFRVAAGEGGNDDFAFFALIVVL